MHDRPIPMPHSPSTPRQAPGWRKTPVDGRPRVQRDRWASILCLTVAVAIVAGVSLAADAPATEKGLRWTAPTDSGRWKVTLTTDATTLQPRRFVTFSLEVRDADGAMVDTPMTFQIGGGMDAHGHGLPTQPQVTDRLGAGRFRLEGVRFNMPGAWQLRVAMRTAAATETVTFQLEVDP